MKSIYMPIIKEKELRNALKLQYGQDFMESVECEYECEDGFLALLYDIGNESETKAPRFVQIKLDIFLGYGYEVQNTVINFLIDAFPNCRYIIVDCEM